jgi:putative two-component system response regulator
MTLAPRILVLDDEPIVRELMVEILQTAGYEASGTDQSGEALRQLSDPRLGLIVSDIVMPGLSGFELIEAVRAQRPSLPVVLVTGAGTQGNLTEALAKGADGFVTKPFSHGELIAAVENVLDRSQRSERDLRERVVTPTLASALANAIEAREASLHGHCERLAALAMRIAEVLGLPQETIETIRLGAILHDVGKIGIPDAILLKSSPLSFEELLVMRRHPLIGDRLLAPLGLKEGVRQVVRHHHERWDGRGYPDGLVGEAIPTSARVIAIADSIEAMAADRPYRQALSVEAMAQELRLGRGAQWDPRVVDAALSLLETGELRVASDGVRLASDTAPELALRSVLLAAADPADAAVARETIERAVDNVSVTHAADLATATRLCRGASFALVVVDDRLPDGSGLELLDTLRHASSLSPLVVVGGEDGGSLAAEAHRRGAAGCLTRRTGYLEDLAHQVRTHLEAA